MNSPFKPIQQALQQELALDVYLRALLEEIPDTPLDETVSVGITPEAATAPEPVGSLALLSLSSEFQKAPLESDVLGIKLAEAGVVRPLALMPDWSRAEFQALFFKVDHLIMATPLITLSRTLKFNRKPTKIPAQPSWFLGLLDDHGKKISVLDSGQLIFGKAKGSLRDLNERPFAYLLISADEKWGLACDDILSVGKLSPEKIRWRTLRTLRPWLIGTVINELAAVIDINQLVPGRK
ncbi:MAG: chemotaxis protein CheW [Methylococcaceae bacterium]